MKIRLTPCLVWLLAAAASFGQTFYGSIVGAVRDVSSGAVPQAKVTLTNLGTAEHRTLETGGSGTYEFVNLVPGQYKVEIEKAGVRHFSRDPIKVEVQSAVRIDVTMQVGDISQLVEVSAETPLLQTENATLGQRLGQLSDWRRAVQRARHLYRWRLGEHLLRQSDFAGSDPGCDRSVPRPDQQHGPRVRTPRGRRHQYDDALRLQRIPRQPVRIPPQQGSQRKHVLQ